MPSPQRAKVIVRLRVSIALALGMVAMGMYVDDRALAVLFIAPVIILGIPIVLLLLVDLGRAIREEAGGHYAATRTTWWLAQLQAAFGAICLGLGGSGFYAAATNWRAITANFGVIQWIELASGLLGALFLLVWGFKLIWTAFVPGRKDREKGRNDA